MHTALLLLALAQFDGLSMWTDAEGVVHVAASTQAPAGATRLQGGSYSVIQGDDRPAVLADGGARSDDARWWKQRFREARRAVQASEALEAAAARDVGEAQQELCVTATAQAHARVVLPPRGRRVAPLVVEARDEQTEQRCARGAPTTAMVNALQLRRVEREQAERALRRLEQEALAERVPLRDWY